MNKLFLLLLIFLIIVVISMISFMIYKKSLYDKLNAIFVMNTDIIILILTIGFINKRLDMFIDIALSYAILGFVTAIILAKYIGGKR